MMPFIDRLWHDSTSRAWTRVKRVLVSLALVAATALGISDPSNATPRAATKSSKHVSPATQAMHIDTSDDFVLRIDDFHTTYQVSALTTVYGNGAVVELRPPRSGSIYRDWSEATSRTMSHELPWLREYLVAIDFAALRSQYVDEHIADGTSITFTLHSSGRRKVVYCSNECPPELWTLIRMVSLLVAAPFRVERVASSEAIERPRTLDLRMPSLINEELDEQTQTCGTMP
jgi:hypothetical protein